MSIDEGREVRLAVFLRVMEVVRPDRQRPKLASWAETMLRPLVEGRVRDVEVTGERVALSFVDESLRPEVERADDVARMPQESHRVKSGISEGGDVLLLQIDVMLVDVKKIEIQPPNLRQLERRPVAFKAEFPRVADDVAAPPEHRLQVFVDPDARRFSKMAEDYFSRHLMNSKRSRRPMRSR